MQTHARTHLPQQRTFARAPVQLLYAVACRQAHCFDCYDRVRDNLSQLLSNCTFTAERERSAPREPLAAKARHASP